MYSYFIKDGGVQKVNNVLVSLNYFYHGAINITTNDEGIFINSPYDGQYMTMATMATGTLVKDSIQPLNLRSRYVLGGLQMVFPQPVVKGTFDIVKKTNMLRGDEDGVVLKVTSKGETKQVGLLGGEYLSNPFEKVTVGGLDISLKYGAKIIQLPFSIKLNDFIADRYPGTENRYSAFASEVTVIDENKEDFNYRIFMNNIKDYFRHR